MAKEYIRKYKIVNPETSPLDFPLLDGFENTLLKWNQSAFGSGGTVTRDATVAYRGEASAKLDTGAATPGAGDFVEMSKDIYQITEKEMTVSLMFRIDAAFSLMTLYIQPNLRKTGTVLKLMPYFMLVIDATGTHLSYGSSWDGLDVSYTLLWETAENFGANTWYHFEVAIDTDKQEYLHAEMGSLKWSMSGIAIPAATVGWMVTSGFTIMLETNTAGQRTIHIDDAVVSYIR